jgi:hypothetical protein
LPHRCAPAAYLIRQQTVMLEVLPGYFHCGLQEIMPSPTNPLPVFGQQNPIKHKSTRLSRMQQASHQFDL